jgi:hypothetical protein
MKKMLVVLSIVLCLFISWNSAAADVINFESLSTSGETTPFSLYQEGGYTLTNDADIIYGDPSDPSWPPTPNAFGWWATSYSGGYAGSLGLFNNYQWLTTTLTKDDNTPFSMYSIDLSRLGGGAPAVGDSVNFTGIKSDDNSAVTQTFTYSETLAFQTFFFSSDFNELKSLSWISASAIQDPQFDNITMSALTTVPEPATLLLLGLGLVGLAGARRKFHK